VDFEVGDRSEETFLRLYGRLPEAGLYRSDAYQGYDWLPADRHEVGKGGAVNRNEGLHSRLRDRINRLHRKTKGYSKSVAMLSDSIALVCLKLGLI
jgi:insertion element IS1 protein InsB